MHHLLFILLILIPSFATGNNIIKDSEIEEAINLVVRPIIKATNLQKLEIHIVNDGSLNAFTIGNNEIYINSGLINQFQNMDIIRGVIAHEIGHILGKHIIRQSENIDNSNKFLFSSIAIGLAGALVSGNVAVINPAIFGGIHVAERSILSHSRTFESSADQTSLRLLEQSGYTCKGMIEFFEYMNRYHSNSFVNKYDQTHPLSQERLTSIRNFYNKSKFQHKRNEPELEYKWDRAIAKLKAFTIEPQKILSLITKSSSNEITHYIKAINYFRNSDINNSIKYVDKLISLKPQDPFYHELKGQILFEFGKKEALDSYRTATKFRPDDLLIRLSQVIVGISIYADDIEKMQEFYKDLKFISNKEPDNITALYYLSVFYEKTGHKSESLLASAIIAYKTGNFDRAKSYAKEAIKGLIIKSPDWHKANDIILLLEKFSKKS